MSEPYSNKMILFKGSTKVVDKIQYMRFKVDAVLN